jgi:hypothetical protein
MQETIETLSMSNQTMDVDYFRRVLTLTDKAVIAAPCGWGKTLGIAAYIAQCYWDGVLYVAERKAQLDEMQTLLVERHHVPEDNIGVYYGGSADLEALAEGELTKPIALLTHSRIQSHSPGKYTIFHRDGKLTARQLLVVDEALPALVILSAPTFFVETWLRRMGLAWKDVGTLDPDDIDTHLNHIKPEMAKHAKVPFEKVGITYLDWTNYLKQGEISISIRSFAYYLMLFHVLQGHYAEDKDGVHTLIPMTPHVSWYKLFDQILILDATASVCDYMYQDYPLLQPGRWNYQDITLGLKYFSSVGNLSKTKTAQHRETIVDELANHVLPHLEDQGFLDPYVVTYKALDGTSFTEDIASILGKRAVQNYGGTRGSNAFRACDAVILVGSYRPPVSFDTLAYQLFGASYSPYKYAVAHWIQEIYRTRIRQHQGEPIQVLAIGQREVIAAFEEITSLFLHPISISPQDNPAYLEKILREVKHHLQKTLLDEVKQYRQVSIKHFAATHAKRDRIKVENAFRGLLKDHPMLQGHLVMDETTIQLVDKPSPI